MAELYCVPLGESMRDSFIQQIEQDAYGQALLVLPGRVDMEKVREISCIRTVNMDFLPNELLRANGRENLIRISRRAQEMIIKDILHKMVSSGELVYFKALSEGDGFVKMLTSFIGELSRGNITAEELEMTFLSWEHGADYMQKDKEVWLIYNYYQELLQKNNWYDIDGLYRLAITEISKAEGKIPWEKLYFSEFYQLDQLQLELIKALKDRCAISFGLVFEADKPRRSAAMLAMYGALMGMGFTLNKVEITTNRTPSLQYFCKYWQSDIPANQGSGENIYCLEALSLEDEMRQVIQVIKQKLLDGAKYEDFLVVVRDIESYNGFRVLFEEYGVPTCLPMVVGFSSQPLVEFLRSILLFSENRMDTDILQSLLKCDFLSILYNFDTEYLEESFNKLFFQNAQSLLSYLDSETMPNASELIRLFTQCEKLGEPQSASKYCEALRNLIQQWQLGAYFGEQYYLQKIGLRQLKEILATEKICYEILDEIDNIYDQSGHGDQFIRVGEFRELWEQISKEKIINLDSGHAQGIRVVEASNVQGIFYKNIFLLGLREGQFPVIKQENWLYNDQERKVLGELGIELQNTRMSLASDEYFFAAVVAAATETLYLSYFVDDTAGASCYLEEFLRYYEDHSVQQVSHVNSLDNCWSKSQFAMFLASAEKLEPAEYSWLEQYVGEDYFRRRHLDKQRFSTAPDYNGILGFGENRNNFSPSRLENYALCPFKYMLEQVWLVNKWQEQSEEIKPNVQGDLYHSVIAEFFNRYLGENISKYNLQELQTLLQQIFEQKYVEFLQAGLIPQSKFIEYEKTGLLNNLKRLLALEYKYQSNLEESLLPVKTEWSFGLDKNSVPGLVYEFEGEKIFLCGQIDRVDQVRDFYVVTDYKRSTTPQKKALKNGLDLQLPIYCLAVEELFAKGAGKVIGSGYFSIEGCKRAGGLWREEASLLPWVHRVPANEFEDLMEVGKKSIENCVTGIKKGLFYAKPQGPCPTYCAGIDICRYSLLGVTAEEEVDNA